MTYKINYPIWNCPKKIEAREQTIIITYKKLYKRKSIPKNRQYWTMSGSYEDHNQNPIEGEFNQLKKEKLITDNQFHAVDIDPNIISQNKKHYPYLNWHCGDFLETMKNYSINNDFDPAIINCDNVKLINKGIKYLASLLMFVEDNVENEVMVLSNLMLNHPYQKSQINSGQEMINILLSIYDFLDNWEIFPYCYKYHGSGRKAQTWMGSLILMKKGK